MKKLEFITGVLVVLLLLLGAGTAGGIEQGTMTTGAAIISLSVCTVIGLILYGIGKIYP